MNNIIFTIIFFFGAISDAQTIDTLSWQEVKIFRDRDNCFIALRAMAGTSNPLIIKSIATQFGSDGSLIVRIDSVWSDLDAESELNWQYSSPLPADVWLYGKDIHVDVQIRNQDKWQNIGQTAIIQKNCSLK